MRAALCMYGKIGGMGGKDGFGKPIDFERCFHAIKRHIIDVNDCDVFMHCWNPEHQKKLLKLYKPKKHTIESQIKFKTTLKTDKDRRDEFICRSRWYSNKQTLNLKKRYEEQNNFTYDWVMLCRYDLLWYVDFDFSILKPWYFYASHFNDWKFPNRENHTVKNNRYLDLWFLASSEFMDRFAELYDKFYDYSITDPHYAVYQHVKSFCGEPIAVTKFVFYRWYDYEIYRNKPI